MRLRILLFVVFSFAIFLFGCGGGMQAPPPAPIFSSTPVTAAAEGVAYTYQILATDPAGKSVTFALTTGPTGATLNGNTVTWKPTPPQSRVANNFAVTATTAEGGSAQQSWSVTPVGTVHISRVDTVWSANGSVMQPFDWTTAPGQASFVEILIPQSDGSVLEFSGSGSADGSFAIANVPGGSYWLRIVPGSAYFTSTSNFDFGENRVAHPITPVPEVQTTTFDLNASGLDPWQAGDFLDFEPDAAIGFASNGPIAPGATSGTVSHVLNSNIDFTPVHSAFVLQYEPLQIGSLSALALGAETTVSNLSISNGAVNTISAALNSSPKSSVNLSVDGSSWAALYNNASPMTAQPFDTSLGLGAQLFFTGGLLKSAFFGADELALFGTTFSQSSPFAILGGLPLPGCSGSIEIAQATNPFSPPMGQAPILTSQNFGSFQFGDPFPQNWIRPFDYCQRALATVTDPSSTSPITVVLQDAQQTTAPSGTVTPLLAAVQSPMINGQNLFTSNTLSTGVVSLSWTAPNTLTPPTGYDVQLIEKITLPNGTKGFATFGRFFTAKTSVTLPFTVPAGTSFIVVISSLLDGTADFETSPLRSGLPTASTEIVSALMTVSPSAPAAAASSGVAFEATPVRAPQDHDRRTITISPSRP